MVKFVDYDGGYPNLCSGNLTLDIDGKEYILKNPLSSGGSVSFTSDWEEIVTSGEWYVNVPDSLSEYRKEIIQVVNDNVPWGCCGGCV